MNERCICPECGRPHRKRKVVDTMARARAGAAARWQKKDQKLASVPAAAKIAAVTQKLDVIVETKRTTMGRPTDLCPHGVEFRFCRMLMCKPPAEVAKSEEIIQRQRAEMGVSMRNHQEKLVAAVEAKTVQGKPTGVCPHGVEFRFCRMLMCKPPAEDGFIRRMEGKK